MERERDREVDKGAVLGQLFGAVPGLFLWDSPLMASKIYVTEISHRESNNAQRTESPF